MKKAALIICFACFMGKTVAQQIYTEKKTEAVICSRFIMLEGDKNYDYLSREFPHFLHLGLKPTTGINFTYQKFLNDSSSRLSISTLKQEIISAARDSSYNDDNSYSGQNIQVQKINNFAALTKTYWDFLVLGSFTEFHGQFKLDIFVLSKNMSDSTSVGLVNFKSDLFNSSNIQQTFHALNEKLLIFLNRPQKKGILTLRLVNTLHKQNINESSFDANTIFGKDLSEDTELLKRLNINTKTAVFFNLDDTTQKLPALAKTNKADLLACMLPGKRNDKQLAIYNYKNNSALYLKLNEELEKDYASQFYWLKFGLLAVVDTTGCLDTTFIRTAAQDLSASDETIKYKTDNLVLAGKLDKAAFLSYSRLLSDKSGSATWTSRFGHIMGLKGNEYLAEKYFLEATKRSNGTNLYLADALFEQKYYEDALREYNKFEVSHPNKKDTVLKNKAIISYYLDDAKTASAYFDDYVKKYPLDNDIIRFKGLISYNQNDYENAVAYFEKLPDTLSSFNKKYYLSRSYNSLANSNNSDKQQYLQKAIYYDKYNINAYEKLLELYNSKLDFNRSDSLITSGIQNYIWEENAKYYNQALQLYFLAAKEQANRQLIFNRSNYYLNKLLEKKDTSFRVFTLKAILYDMMLKDSSLLFFSKAIKASPNNTLGYLNYSEALMMHNKPPVEALRALDNIVTTDGINENQNKLLYLYLKLCATRLSGTKAEIQRSKKNFDEALTPFYSSWSFTGFENWASSSLNANEKKDILNYTKAIKDKQQTD